MLTAMTNVEKPQAASMLEGLVAARVDKSKEGGNPLTEALGQFLPTSEDGQPVVASFSEILKARLTAEGSVMSEQQARSFGKQPNATLMSDQFRFEKTAVAELVANEQAQIGSAAADVPTLLDNRSATSTKAMENLNEVLQSIGERLNKPTALESNSAWNGSSEFSEKLQAYVASQLQSADSEVSAEAGDLPETDLTTNQSLMGFVKSVLAQVTNESSSRPLERSPQNASLLNGEAVASKMSFSDKQAFVAGLNDLVASEFSETPEKMSEWNQLLQANLPNANAQMGLHAAAVEAPRQNLDAGLSNVAHSLRDAKGKSLDAVAIPGAEVPAQVQARIQGETSLETEFTGRFEDAYIEEIQPSELDEHAAENVELSLVAASEIDNQAVKHSLMHAERAQQTIAEKSVVDGAQAAEGISEENLAAMASINSEAAERERSGAQGQVGQSLGQTVGNGSAQAGGNASSQASASAATNGAMNGYNSASQSESGKGSQQGQSGQEPRQAERPELRAEAKGESEAAKGLAAEAKNSDNVVNKTAINAQQLAQQISNLMAQGKSAEMMDKAPMNQMMQAQQKGLEQQANLRAVEASSMLSTTVDADGNIISESGLTDRRANLPPSLQTIPLPVKHPQWGQALGQRVVYMTNSQIQQAQITLNPEKLGPIHIKLHMDRDQQIQVSMSAQHGTTREAIESAIPRLREMLEQAGVQLASVDVGDFSQFAQEQFGDDANNNDGQVSVMEAGVTTEDGVSEAESTVQIQSDQLVDYYA